MSNVIDAYYSGKCICQRCQNEMLANEEFPSFIMALCPTCGNKRCPKGTNHDLGCTGSNEPGQEGSQYAAVFGPPPTIEELKERLGL